MITPQREHREIAARTALVAQKCSCGEILYPKRVVCPKCRNTEFEEITLARTGKIMTFTRIEAASEDFALETPFPMALVKLDDGRKIMGQIADCFRDEDYEKIQIGGKVEIEIRKIQEDGEHGIISFGPKFKLVIS